MEITSLNEEFFGKCKLKQRLGLVTNNKGTITFKPKNGDESIVITDDKMVKRWDNSKFNRKKLKDNITIIGKMLINEDAQYIICKHDDLTFNGQELSKGSVVVRTNKEYVIYKDITLFLAEITARQTPDLKEAARIFKANKGKILSGFTNNKLTVNDAPNNVIELSARDAHRYVLDAFLVKTSEEGGVFHWGWRLKDASGQLIELPDIEVKNLVSHGQVKDTILDGDSLKGVNYDIDLLDQDYAS